MSEDHISRHQEEADNNRRDALSREYGEVCNNFRTLTDIRFKLLALLPIAAAAAVAAVTGNASGQQHPPEMMLVLSLFGFVVTIALVTYNARNNQLYFELVSRAATIERSLNIPDGAFCNRPGTWQRVTVLGKPLWTIDHGIAISTIYGASIALWLFGVVRYALAVDVLNVLPQDSPASRENLIALTIAIAVTLLGSLWVKTSKEKRSKHIKQLAREAMKKALEPQSSVGDFAAFIKVCAGEDAKSECFIKKCAELSGKKEDKVRKRAAFYARLARCDRERLRYYLPQGPNDLQASHFIGLLTDLSPYWIYDLYHNRMD